MASVLFLSSWAVMMGPIIYGKQHATRSTHKSSTSVRHPILQRPPLSTHQPLRVDRRCGIASPSDVGSRSYSRHATMITLTPSATDINFLRT